jgi:hypothetical protein
MQFLEGNQIEEWCAERGLASTPNALKASITSVSLRRTYGQQAAPRGQEGEIAELFVGHLNSWTESLLWVTSWGIWPSSEDWPKYYALRGAQGERRSLDTAPGHLFASAEHEPLVQFLRVVLENAWDAFVLPAVEREFAGQVIVASHDEWVEIRSLARGQVAAV